MTCEDTVKANSPSTILALRGRNLVSPNPENLKFFIRTDQQNLTQIAVRAFALTVPLYPPSLNVRCIRPDNALSGLRAVGMISEAGV